MKLKKASIVFNILNIFVMVLLILGVCFAIFAISVLFGIFGADAVKSVMAKLFQVGSLLIAPHVFIFVFTIVALACVICKKEQKLLNKPKRVETFMVIYIVCLVLSALCMFVPFAIGIYNMAKNSAHGIDNWDGLGVLVLYIVLEAFSIITSAISIKYLNNIQKKIEYKEED